MKGRRELRMKAVAEYVRPSELQNLALITLSVDHTPEA